MFERPSSETVIAQQLAAFNARDLEAWLDTYAPDATQYDMHGARLAAGRIAIAERMAHMLHRPDTA